MNHRDKWAIGLTLAVVGIVYALIIQIDFGPIPRAQKKAQPSLVEDIHDPSRIINAPRTSLTEDDVLSVEEQNILQNPQNSMAVKREGKYLIVANDILVDENQVIATSSPERAQLEPLQLWEGGRIPYQVQAGKMQRRILRALEIFTKHTMVKFTEHIDEEDFIIFREVADDVCLSYLGRRGGDQDVVLGPKCSLGHILHALMHTLGIVHDHNRFDRDEKMVVHWENILPSEAHQLQKLSSELTTPGEVDFQSLLILPPLGLSRNNLYTVTQQDGSLYQVNRRYLSQGDIRKINNLYTIPSDKL